MQIYCNKRKRLHKKRVQLPGDWFGTPTWKPLHCFGTPIWPRWRHAKTLYWKKSKNIFIAVDISQFLALYILQPIAAALWIAGIKREYLTIIPRARMGSESITHEAEGRIGHWLRVHEGERSNCFSNINVFFSVPYLCHICCFKLMYDNLFLVFLFDCSFSMMH